MDTATALDGNVTNNPNIHIDEGILGSKSSEKQIRKIICRYGRGCTHMHDPIHRERFWHPSAPVLTEEQLRTHYICNECGYASPSLQELQLHLQRKTAWSNTSLIGCRISCLIDSKEWHEGFVTQFHRSGKHYVEFRQIGEKRWLNMKKMAFYIVERPLLHNTTNGSSEYKDNEQGMDADGLAPIDDNWVYVDDLTLDYAFAQSVLFKIFGSVIQETGHKTRGHVCLTDDDRDGGNQARGSLLYGELLPRGANKAFGPKRLAAQDANVLFDLGMGTGKIAMQAFLQFRNLQYVYGVELSMGRYCLAEEAALRMVELLGKETFKVQVVTGRMIVITEILASDHDHGRVLHMECGNMFDVQNIEIADIVMLETDIPGHLQPELCELLQNMHYGARTLTYLDLRRIWTAGAGLFGFRQMDCNRHLSDRFPTSWSVQRGHHFFLWTKVRPDAADLKPDPSHDSDDSVHTPNGRKLSLTNANANMEDFSREEDEDEESFSMERAPKPRGCLSKSLRSLFGFGSFRSSSNRKTKRSGADHEIERNERVIPINADGSKTAATASHGAESSSSPVDREKEMERELETPRSSRLGADMPSIEARRRAPKVKTSKGGWDPNAVGTSNLLPPGVSGVGVGNGSGSGSGSGRGSNSVSTEATLGGIATSSAVGGVAILSPRARGDNPRSSSWRQEEAGRASPLPLHIHQASSANMSGAGGGSGGGGGGGGANPQQQSFSPVRQFHESDNMHTPEILRPSSSRMAVSPHEGGGGGGGAGAGTVTNRPSPRIAVGDGDRMGKDDRKDQAGCTLS